MRIAYVVPGPMSKGPMGLKEMRRREALLNSWAFAGTTVSVIDVAEGPVSIESAYEEALSVPATIELIMRCEREGFDAAIIGCFGDPGLEAARELTAMPVIGPCESSLLLAASLGHKFSVLTVFDSLIAGQELLAYKAGVRDKLASVRATGIPVLDLPLRRDDLSNSGGPGRNVEHADTLHLEHQLVLGNARQHLAEPTDLRILLA